MASERKWFDLFFFFFLMSSFEDEAEADSSTPPRASAPDVFGTCSLLPTLKRRPGGEQDSGACPRRHRCTGVTQAGICAGIHTYTRTHAHTLTPGMGPKQQQSATLLSGTKKARRCLPDVLQNASVQRSAGRWPSVWLTPARPALTFWAQRTNSLSHAGQITWRKSQDHSWSWPTLDVQNNFLLTFFLAVQARYPSSTFLHFFSSCVHTVRNQLVV